MVKITVTAREIELLRLCYKTMGIPKNYALNEDCIVINGDELGNLDIMVNCILDAFLCVGLTEKDEPNDVGFELERLNQKIIHRYVQLNGQNL